MPDWSYRTVFHPLLLGLGPDVGRRFALGVMGTLGRIPFGRRVIEFMGHMTPDSRLRVERNGCSFPTPVGIGCRVDPDRQAIEAFCEFGVGLVEVGPVVRRPRRSDRRIELDRTNRSLSIPPGVGHCTPQEFLDRTSEIRRGSVRLFARLVPVDAEDATELMRKLEQIADGFLLPLEMVPEVRAEEESRSVLAVVSPLIDDAEWKSERLRSLVEDGVIDGLWIEPESKPDGTIVLTESDSEPVRETIRRLRSELGPTPILIAGAGIFEPGDALAVIEAGADLVTVDAGLIFTGPGLPKRINEAVLHDRLTTEKTAMEPSSTTDRSRLGNQSWFWAFLMGLGMFLGGILAMLFSANGVLLPYDEQLSGLSAEDMICINPKLLDFMAHDRVTLAGTMLAIGILYMTLARFGIAKGLHWAYVTVTASAFAGFCSFFAFLGFGYFDPFHAFVTAILFQLLLLCVHSELGERQPGAAPELTDTPAWRRLQWGQLMFVAHGAALIVAGVVISIVGMTRVFVREDLEFLETSLPSLIGGHDGLVPLVAHDRATFGGMLVACGVVTLLPALWGFRRGQFWLWWALLFAGSVAYGSTLAVHWIVGYTSLLHLLPAYAGLSVLWIGCGLSRTSLLAKDGETDAAWSQIWAVRASDRQSAPERLPDDFGGS